MMLSGPQTQSKTRRADIQKKLAFQVFVCELLKLGSSFLEVRECRRILRVKERAMALLVNPSAKSGL